ncbi:MAG: response regulator [Sandaracinaceae bacterium]
MSALARIRVLLLEDEPMDAELVERQLRRSQGMRFDVQQVASLGDALTTLAEERFDVVLTDLALPDSFGSNTVMRLTDAAPLTPLVVFTSSVDDQLRQKVLELGVQDFVPKHGVERIDLVRGLTFAVQRGRHLARLRRIVSDNVDGCLIVSMEGDILFANRAASQVLGRPERELLGQSFGFPVIGSEHADIELHSPTHGTVFCEMRSAEIDWDNEVAHLVSLRDVTDRRRAQELERRLQHADRLASIGSLAAGVAHEINNPATFIQVNLDMVARDSLQLLDELNAYFTRTVERLPESERGEFEREYTALNLDARLREMADLSNEGLDGVARITSIVRTLSSFARVDQDSAELIDPNDLVHDAARMVRHDLRHRARFELDLAPLPALVCDRSKMAQVLVNLLVNASHALDDESEDNVVEVRSRFANGEIFITVRDTGCGIPREQLGRIFEPFFTTKRRDHGTGLGLSISADTVQRHGGRIEVESEVGDGTAFNIILPEQTPYFPSYTPSRATPAMSAVRPGRILLVDDEPLVRRSIVRLLKGRHEVIEAEDGQHALKILEADDTFDAILCDLMMPGTDGITLYQELEKTHPALTRRMAFITGGVFSSRARRFVSEAAPLVIEKPIARASLFATIERLLDTNSPL